MIDDRDAAWVELRAVLPDWWVVVGPAWRGSERLWAVYARPMSSTREDRPWAEAFGETEAIALRALAQQFRVGQA
jgi:hypothetical protein